MDDCSRTRMESDRCEAGKIAATESGSQRNIEAATARREGAA
jgi:hypothetical protein